uniref:Uncharacterized protein n=1 Tax=Noccaea caerulescens TaxID=107243 RepID=A0A1J3ENG4_NOCCA
MSNMNVQFFQPFGMIKRDSYFVCVRRYASFNFFELICKPTLLLPYYYYYIHSAEQCQCTHLLFLHVFFKSLNIDKLDLNLNLTGFDISQPENHVLNELSVTGDDSALLRQAVVENPFFGTRETA